VSFNLTKRLLAHYRANSPRELIQEAENAPANSAEQLTLLVYQQWHMSKILGELTKGMGIQASVEIPYEEDKEPPPTKQ